MQNIQQGYPPENLKCDTFTRKIQSVVNQISEVLVIDESLKNSLLVEILPRFERIREKVQYTLKQLKIMTHFELFEENSEELKNFLAGCKHLKYLIIPSERFDKYERGTILNFFERLLGETKVEVSRASYGHIITTVPALQHRIFF